MDPPWIDALLMDLCLCFSKKSLGFPFVKSRNKTRILNTQKYESITSGFLYITFKDCNRLRSYSGFQPIINAGTT